MKIRVTVTLEQAVLAELRRTVGSRGISAFVNEAVRQRLPQVRLQRLLAELKREHGPIPDEVQADVDRLEWPN